MNRVSLSCVSSRTKDGNSDVLGRFPLTLFVLFHPAVLNRLFGTQ